MNQTTDDRWGEQLPWFLRYPTTPATGDFATCFARIGQRLDRLMLYNEASVINMDHFGACLETDTLQRFHHRAGIALGGQLREYFNPAAIRQETESRVFLDEEELDLSRREQSSRGPVFDSGFRPAESEELTQARQAVNNTRPSRVERHRHELIRERLTLLETLLLNIWRLTRSATTALATLIQDLRRAFAEAKVPLDIRGDPPVLVPLDETLLQHEVIDPLLSRLRARWPKRADELIAAYHDVLAGRNLDEVFSAAFKTLEEIARALTGDARFDFSAEQLKRYYPQLHPTIVQTLVKLRAHRGDAAAHGREGPSPREIRYLLFQICNSALLLLDQ